ncbi:hypothetical protein P3S68_000875 [Capsicum galapagoense]
MKIILEAHNIFSLHFSSIYNGVSTQQPIDLEHPLKQFYRRTQVLGYHRGLIFINNLIDNVAVWNPSTKMFRKLPVCRMKPPSRIPQ